MYQRCILFLMLSQYSSSQSFEEIFNGADDIIASEIGDIFEARRRLNSIPDNGNDTVIDEESDVINATEANSKSNTVPYMTTTPKISMATTLPDIEAKLMKSSLKDIKRRHLMQQLDKIFSDNATVSDSITNSDVGMLTRKLDAMLQQNRRVGDTRRESNYQSGDDKTQRLSEKSHVINLISHFCYITRYKLSFAQLLRKKYHHTHRYRIGFLFALLRQLKNSQKWINFVLQYYSRKIQSVFFELKLVEKLQKLDTDIKDVVLYLEKMEYWRNIAYNPKFYEYSLELYPSFGFQGVIPNLNDLSGDKVPKDKP